MYLQKYPINKWKWIISQKQCPGEPDQTSGLSVMIVWPCHVPFLLCDHVTRGLIGQKLFPHNSVTMLSITPCQVTDKCRWVQVGLAASEWPQQQPKTVQKKEPKSLLSHHHYRLGFRGMQRRITDSLVVQDCVSLSSAESQPGGARLCLTCQRRITA